MRYQLKDSRPCPRRCSRRDGSSTSHRESSKSAGPALGSLSCVWLGAPVAFTSGPGSRCDTSTIDALLYRHCPWPSSTPARVRSSMTPSGTVAVGSDDPGAADTAAVETASSATSKNVIFMTSPRTCIADVLVGGVRFGHRSRDIGLHLHDVILQRPG